MKGLLKHREITAAVAVIVLIALIAAVVTLLQHAGLKDQPALVEEQQTYPYYRLLDGTGVMTEEASTLRPYAVMIDNSSDARPAVGVENATLVYETIAEGAITRMVALFDPTNLPEKIGPIRSLRPYYLAWAEESDAIIVHVGGSPQALEDVADNDNINEFFAGNYFYRDKNRDAPHNAFSSQELLLSATELYEYTTSTTFSSWQYGPIEAATSTVAETVTVDFSIDAYEVRWEYNPENSRYKRFLDAIEQASSADTIVIQVVPARVIDSQLRRDVAYIGSGTAWVVRDGKAVLGTWAKPDANSKTRFFDTHGSAIPFKRGTTWLEIIDDEGRVKFGTR